MHKALVNARLTLVTSYGRQQMVVQSNWTRLRVAEDHTAHGAYRTITGENRGENHREVELTG